MSFPRLATVSAAAVAGALAFYVITKSGFAGTVFGAALWSAVYSVFSHYAGSSFERGGELLRRRRVLAPGEDVSQPAGGVEPAAARPSDRGVAATAAEPERELQATELLGRGRSSGGPMERLGAALRGPGRSAVLRWAPLGFSVAALAGSVVFAYSQEPTERLVVTERVIEKPIVEERVIVEEHQTTVTVPVPSRGTESRGAAPAPAAGGDPAPAAPSPAPQATTPSSTTSTTEATTTTTAPPAASPPTTVAPLTTDPPPAESPAP